MFDEIQTRLREQFGSDSYTTSEFKDNRRIHVKADRVHHFLTYLKEVLGFDMLFELTAADYLKYPTARDRFGVIYGIMNTTTGERLFTRRSSTNRTSMSRRSSFFGAERIGWSAKSTTCTASASSDIPICAAS